MNCIAGQPYDWFVYRCDECRTWVYVRADLDDVKRACPHALRLIDVRTAKVADIAALTR